MKPGRPDRHDGGGHETRDRSDRRDPGADNTGYGESDVERRARPPTPPEMRGRAWQVVLVLGNAKPPQVGADDRDDGCAESDGAKRGHKPDAPSVGSPTITSSAFRSRHVARLEL